jgi:hypothetical protein
MLGTGFGRSPIVANEWTADAHRPAVGLDPVQSPDVSAAAAECAKRARRRKERTEEENRMATARLRVFPHPDEELQDEAHAPSVPIRLADLYPLLAQAYRDNYVWLRDFEDDQLLVSNDLYEVVRAFSNCRPSA